MEAEPALEVYKEYLKQNVHLAKPRMFCWTEPHDAFIKDFMLKNGFFNVAHRVEWLILCLNMGLDLPEGDDDSLSPEAVFLVKRLTSKVQTITNTWLKEGKLEKLPEPLASGARYRLVTDEDRVVRSLVAILAECANFPSTIPIIQKWLEDGIVAEAKAPEAKEDKEAKKAKEAKEAKVDTHQPGSRLRKRK